MRLLIDTDPGVDDAYALALTANGATVEAIYTSAGNVGLAQTTANALQLTELYGLDAPVIGGAATPLLRVLADAAHVHGSDGLGGCARPVGRQPAAGIAALDLIARARAEPGALTLVCLGPLTNLALALRLWPELATALERVVVMGGALHGCGNAPEPAAEFNFYADPEAAAIVMGSGARITLIDWELVLRSARPIDAQRAVWAALTGPGAWLAKASAAFVDFIEAERPESGFCLADPLAMAVALDRSLIARVLDRPLFVRHGPVPGAGQSVIDWNRRSGQPDVELVLEVDFARYWSAVDLALAELGARVTGSCPSAAVET